MLVNKMFRKKRIVNRTLQYVIISFWDLETKSSEAQWFETYEEYIYCN